MVAATPTPPGPPDALALTRSTSTARGRSPRPWPWPWPWRTSVGSLALQVSGAPGSEMSGPQYLQPAAMQRSATGQHSTRQRQIRERSITRGPRHQDARLHASRASPTRLSLPGKSSVALPNGAVLCAARPRDVLKMYGVQDTAQTEPAGPGAPPPSPIRVLRTWPGWRTPAA